MSSYTPPLMPPAGMTAEQLSMYHFGAGFVLAADAAVNQNLQQLIDKERQLNSALAKTGLDSALSAGNSAALEGGMMAGTSFAQGAGAGYGAYQGVNGMREAAALQQTQAGEIRGFEDQLNALDQGHVAFMPNNAGGNADGIQLQEMARRPNDPQARENLLRNRENVRDGHDAARKELSDEADKHRNIGQAVSGFVQIFTNGLSGNARQQQQLRQGMQNVQNQSANVAQSAIDSIRQVIDGIIGGMGQLFGGYARLTG